jgi:hypothetical protein
MRTGRVAPAAPAVLCAVPTAADGAAPVAGCPAGQPAGQPAGETGRHPPDDLVVDAVRLGC